MSVREPAVAGMFYSRVSAELKKQVEVCFLGPGGPGVLPVVRPDGPRRILGLVSPHAGLMYSGSVAANAYLRLAEDGLPDVALILAPNHRSYYPSVALTDDLFWSTPLGELAVDQDLNLRIVSAFSQAMLAPHAHRAEHAVEVQLPFLQYIGDARVKIVPILIGGAARMEFGELEFVREFAEVLAGILADTDAVLIASTDFTHYESASDAEKQDSRAIESILALDEQGLIENVENLDISMCGVLPTAVTISVCKRLGAVEARKLAYRNSGDTTGDYSEVVGYAALEIIRDQ